MPDYYQPNRVSVSGTFGEAMLGNLVSPARGLFVYSPVLLLALSGLVLALRQREERLLSACFAIIVVMHWLVVSRFPHWWGGHSYGPRFMTDIVPFLAYFVAFNLEALRKVSGRKRWASLELHRVAGCRQHDPARPWRDILRPQYLERRSERHRPKPCPVVGLARSPVRARLVVIDRPTVCTIGMARPI